MDWFETWFDTEYYHILYNNRDYKEAELFISGLTKYLQLPTKAKIIDLACGKGRHSVYLNQLGYDVLGLDLSKHSIEYDKQFENETLKFAVHDMRNPLPIKDVDAVFNLFTSFGYFLRPLDEDRKIFLSVNRGLKKGGKFVLDYLNRGFVQKGLKDSYDEVRGDIVFHIHKKIEDNHVVKEINFTDQGKEHQFFERVKLHTPEIINEYAESSGFKRIKIWVDYQLNDFNPETSPRCINLFEKISEA